LKPFVGPLNLARCSTLAKEEVTCFAVSMLDLPDARRQALGSKLINEGMSFILREAASLSARSPNVASWLVSMNPASLKLYEKYGFEHPLDGPDLKLLAVRGERLVAMSKVISL
jgi:GNAT superfamily N-acetyltransferase